MRLCRFLSAEGSSRLGIVEGEEVVDLSAAELQQEPAAALAAVGPDALTDMAMGAPRIPLAEAPPLAPATPRKYLAIALNYRDHIAEMGMEAPEVPVFFNKQVTCVVGPGAEIHMP